MHSELEEHHHGGEAEGPEEGVVAHDGHHSHDASGPLRTIKEAKANRHHRQMVREIRWPITSTSHKLTW